MDYSNDKRHFQVAEGLVGLVPDAQYSNQNNTNIEEEYNEMVQDDTRAQPTQEDCSNAAVDIYRRKCAAEVNEITANFICYAFRFSLAPDVPIQSEQEWQFDILVLIDKKDSGQIPYPYYLKASENRDSSTNYILIPTSDALALLEYEFFIHVATQLAIGRTVKDGLKTMTLNELIEFEDTRVAPKKYDWE